MNIFQGSTTQIFLDSGNPNETKAVLDKGFSLDGQTTNPSLVAQSPLFQERAKQGALTLSELFDLYKQTVTDIFKYLPDGSISIEVYAGENSTTEDLLSQARKLVRSLPYSQLYIKLPITVAGLEAAHILVAEGIHINMTLCFSQEQAIAVHQATLGSKRGQVYVSPFIGRLDDRGEKGTDLIHHILKHYKNVESHVLVLAASIRSQKHIDDMLTARVDIMTIPFKVFEMLQNQQKEEVKTELVAVPFQEIDYTKSWTALNIKHELTDTGLAKFKKDWDNLLTT